MAKRIFVNCTDYNGYKNIKFVMKLDDPRNEDPYSGYEPIAVVDVKKNRFTHNDTVYKVFSDWSVTPAK